MSREQKPPEVGMGATLRVGSDAYPYTIVEVTGKTLTAQRDNAKLVSGSRMSEDQEYEYEPNPNAKKNVFTLRKNGRWVEKGAGMNSASLFIGHRRQYMDPSY